MKNTINLYFIFILLIFQNCKPIQVLESHNYNYYLFNTTGIKPLNSVIYRKGKSFLLKEQKAKYDFDASFYKKQLDIVKGKDTMYIYCFCFDAINYYFKDIKFKIQCNS